MTTSRLDQLADGDDKLLADYDAIRRAGLTVFNAGTEVTFTSYTYDDVNSQPDHLISLSNWRADTDVAVSTFEYTYENEGNRENMEVGPVWERDMVLDLLIIPGERKYFRRKRCMQIMHDRT